MKTEWHKRGSCMTRWIPSSLQDGHGPEIYLKSSTPLAKRTRRSATAFCELLVGGDMYGCNLHSFVTTARTSSW